MHTLIKQIYYIIVVIKSMDPLKYKLPEFDSIPVIDPEQIDEFTVGKKYVIFQNLIVDTTDFIHPGHNKYIQENESKQISESFFKIQHSFNARLVLCHRTIARIRRFDDLQDQKAKVFYNEIKESSLNQSHEKILSKMNFQNSIFDELHKLTSEEQEILIKIPKIFKDPSTITIKSKDSWLEEFMSSQYFWLTTFYFQAWIWVLIYYVCSTYELGQISKKIYLVFFGMIKWTILEYIIHRFIFHHNRTSKLNLFFHSAHHAFPNLNRKVAITITSSSIKVALMALFYAIFLSFLSIALLFIGLLTAMVCYDAIHYYCHFGDQYPIKWLEKLRVNHLKHHYKDADLYFGVTNTIWDWVFGTSEEEGLKQKI